MPMVQITSKRQGPVLEGTETSPYAQLHRLLNSETGPVTVMIHGYKYQPGHPTHCPHHSLTSLSPKRNAAHIVSLPRNLGAGDRAGHGVGISYGWSARGTIWQAYRMAGQAGDHLAQILAQIQALDPSRDIRLFGHSLGARVALRAMSESGPGVIRKAILLAAAEFRVEAIEALHSPGGYGCEVLHATSRENDLFDFMLEKLISPPAATPVGNDLMLGHRLLYLRNLAHLQLDHAPSLEALTANGYPIAAPERKICHWSPYRRSGVFPLYRAFLSGDVTVDQLHRILPQDLAPRWSRLRRTRARRHTGMPRNLAL